jgi:SPP1 family phage portal protein
MVEFLGKQRFSKIANERFQYRRQQFEALEDYPTGLINVVQLFIDKHIKNQVPRLQELKRYYDGDNNIHYRAEKTNSQQADNRIASDYARYVTIFMQGYVLGNPVKYENKNSTLLDQITDFTKYNRLDYEDSLIETDLSIYGRAYELIYLDENAKECVVKLSPESTFVVYDTSVKPKPLFAVHYYSIHLGDDTTYIVNVYTEKSTLTLISEDSIYSGLEVETDIPNDFGDVQVIEYANNYDRFGDFENVLDSIDAYDLSQSELANFQQDSNDAILVIKGNPYTGTAENAYQTDKDGNLVLDKNNEPISIENSPADVLMDMIKAHILIMDDNPNPDGPDPDAKWLIKQYDTTGAETYKQRMVDDILRFTFTPDTNDQNFAGTQSGEAMKYKLLGNDNLRKVKERLLSDGFMRRLLIVNAIWKIKGNDDQQVEDTNIIFTPNLPEDVAGQVDMATAIHGIVSNETVVGMLTEVTGVDAKKELQRLSKQQEKQAETFGGYPTGNEQPKVDDKDATTE